jgi:hypothetical protein
MKWLFILTSILGASLCSNYGVYVISRLYEGIFFYVQYDYLGMFDEEKYEKVLSYHEKLIWKKGDLSPELEACLKGKNSDSRWLFSASKSMETFWVSIEGKEYVIKRHLQKGFFKNLMHMGKCVSIWNNLKWGDSKGIPVVDPIALYEKRRFNEVATTIIYPFEGNRLDYLLRSETKEKIQGIISCLRKEHVVHADLRRRNIIYRLDHDDIKLIDVQLMHYYPEFSYVGHQRLAKEERWLLKEYKH